MMTVLSDFVRVVSRAPKRAAQPRRQRRFAVLAVACTTTFAPCTSANSSGLQSSVPTADPNECPARLVVHQVRVERVSDWARLDVAARVHRDCFTPPAETLSPPVAQEWAPDEAVLFAWPEDGAILGLLEEDGARRVPAVVHEEGRRRFYASQRGRAGSRGKVLLLDSVNSSQARVRVRPLGLGEDVSFRYRALLPLQYAEGKWRLHLEDLPPEAVVEFAPGLSPERLRDKGGPTYQWSEGGFGLQGELARIPWSDGTATLDWHLRVAPEIRPIGDGAPLIVALDVSRSMSPEQLRRAREVARRWLQGHRAARVAVLAFDRRVRRLTSGFVSLENALQALAAPSEQGNGSFQELALAESARWLSAVAGEGRLLLLSDGHVRRRLAETSLRKALPPGSPWLLYGELRGSKVDHRSSAMLGELARSHGDYLRCDEGDCDVSSLLAPSRIEEVTVSPALYHAGISPWPLGAVSRGSRVAPFGDTLSTDALSGRVRYRSWGVWEERAFSADPQVTETALAWRTAKEDGCRREPRWAELTRVVTPEWSYVRRWPGAIARYVPLTQESGAGSCSGICDDCAAPGPKASISKTLAQQPPKPLRGEPWWGERWSKGAVACGAPRAHVQLWLDGAEIEDVELRPTGLGARVDECLSELAWNLVVPAGAGAASGVPVILESGQ